MKLVQNFDHPFVLYYDVNMAHKSHKINKDPVICDGSYFPMKKFLVNTKPMLICTTASFINLFLNCFEIIDVICVSIGLSKNKLCFYS
jgi:hypothetical protein